MSRRRIAAAVLISCLFIPIGASAQERNDPGWTIGGIAGFGRTWDDESQIGGGVLIGGRLDGRIVGGLRFEGSVDWLRHDRDEGALLSEGHTTLLGGVLKYRFGNPQTHGYVLGGPVLAFHSGTTAFVGVERELTSRDPGITFGGGFAGRVAGRYEIGPEARFVMLWTNDGLAPTYAIYGGVKIALQR